MSGRWSLLELGLASLQELGEALPADEAAPLQAASWAAPIPVSCACPPIELAAAAPDGIFDSKSILTAEGADEAPEAGEPGYIDLFPSVL